VELREECGHVFLDGLLGDTKVGGDLLVPRPAQDKPEDLELAGVMRKPDRERRSAPERRSVFIEGLIRCCAC